MIHAHIVCIVVEYVEYRSSGWGGYGGGGGGGMGGRGGGPRVLTEYHNLFNISKKTNTKQRGSLLALDF